MFNRELDGHIHAWVKTGEYQACQPPHWGAKCECGAIAPIRLRPEIDDMVTPCPKHGVQVRHWCRTCPQHCGHRLLMKPKHGICNGRPNSFYAWCIRPSGHKGWCDPGGVITGHSNIVESHLNG